ncbi:MULTISPECIES: hypothetical protein [unclassified Thioalkalivibrio]|uniref:hypothetical protein n=1 Tax=unclassified Thioalkalivibrio TaxID=2621013 RepID=UPI00036D9722|nr:MULTISPECIES: hypothetical protein [unclassified Thioalkalivibrio]
MAEFSLTLHARDESQPELRKVSVAAEGELPEYGQVWMWDIVYAQQLFALGEVQAAQNLKETMELWAVNMSSKVFQPHGHILAKGYLDLSENLQLVSGDEVPAAAEGDRQVVVSVDGQAGQLPDVRVSPESLAADERQDLVLGLGQYFNFENPMFARELPIHVLAMRKYHADINLPHTREALDEAPFFAIQKAMEYFQAANEGTVQ